MLNLDPQLNFDLAESNFWKTDNRLKWKAIKMGYTVSYCINFKIRHESHYWPCINVNYADYQGTPDKKMINGT